jgi:uncharacterized protein with von Willebrand factor type A (vWA) domain
MAKTKTLADLGDFLAVLRASGVPVGPTEIARLRWLFGRAPHLERDGLKSLIGALLIKTPEHHRTFEALFAESCPEREADWPAEVGPAPGGKTGKGMVTPSSPLPDLEDEDDRPPPRKP